MGLDFRVFLLLVLLAAGHEHSEAQKERERRFGQDDHVRKFGLDYAERIRSQGLIVNEIDLANDLPAEVVEHYGLPKGEIIYQAVKPA